MGALHLCIRLLNEYCCLRRHFVYTEFQNVKTWWRLRDTFSSGAWCIHGPPACLPVHALCFCFLFWEDIHCSLKLYVSSKFSNV